MSDFLELTTLQPDTKGYDHEVKKWISKYQITELEPDPDHNQTFVYYRGVEIRVRETINQIQAKCLE